MERFSHNVFRILVKLSSSYKKEVCSNFLKEYKLDNIPGETIRKFKEPPENKMLLMNTIQYYSDDEFYTSKIIAKINNIKLNDITIYAMEKGECALSSFVEDKVNGYNYFLDNFDIITYREFEKIEGPLIINWHWISNSLRRKLFQSNKKKI